MICLEAERQISGMKAWHPEKLGRTVVDGSIQIGRKGFVRRGSSYSDFCYQGSGYGLRSIEIGVYRETLRPFIDTLFDLVMFLSADRGRWGEEIGLPFRWDP